METAKIGPLAVDDRIISIIPIVGYGIAANEYGIIVGISDTVPGTYFAQFDCKPRYRIIVYTNEVKCVTPSGRMVVPWSNFIRSVLKGDMI